MDDIFEQVDCDQWVEESLEKTRKMWEETKGSVDEEKLNWDAYWKACREDSEAMKNASTLEEMKEIQQRMERRSEERRLEAAKVARQKEVSEMKKHLEAGKKVEEIPFAYQEAVDSAKEAWNGFKDIDIKDVPAIDDWSQDQVHKAMQKAVKESELDVNHAVFDQAMALTGRHYRGTGGTLAEKMGLVDFDFYGLQEKVERLGRQKSVELEGLLIFYVGVGMLPPDKVDSFVEQMKDRCAALHRLPATWDVVWIPVRNYETKVETIRFKEVMNNAEEAINQATAKEKEATRTEGQGESSQETRDTSCASEGGTGSSEEAASVSKDVE